MNNNKILSWSDNHKKRYTWLYNKLKTLKINDIIYNESNYINKLTAVKIINIIKNDPNWSNNSKETLYFMVARWLEINDPLNDDINYIKNLGYKTKQETEEAEGNNEQDEKEKINYRDQTYFINILDNIDIKKLNTLNEHYKYLLLLLLVNQPPLRTDFYISAQFTTTKPTDKENNYIYINKSSNEIYYIINHDKVSNTKTYNNNDLSYIEIKNELLKKSLFYSYDHYKRNFLFELHEGPITQNTLLNYLRAITEVKQINFDIMRSSYINHFYENNKTYRARDELAKKMRHSQLTASKNYYKDIQQENNKIKKIINGIV